MIRLLLKEAGMLAAGTAGPQTAAAGAPDYDPETTPETYLGYGRAGVLAGGTQLVRDQPAEYSLAGSHTAGQWSLGGTWTAAREYIVPASTGVLELGFHARRVFLVIEAGAAGGRIEVSVDAGSATDTVVEPRESRLHELVDLAEAGEHVLRLKVEGGLRLFAFTFG